MTRTTSRFSLWFGSSRRS